MNEEELAQFANAVHQARVPNGIRNIPEQVVKEVLRELIICIAADPERIGDAFTRLIGSQCVLQDQVQAAEDDAGWDASP